MRYLVFDAERTADKRRYKNSFGACGFAYTEGPLYTQEGL